MSWLYLGIAVVFEITVAISAGKAQGFTRPAWTAATLVSGGIATYFLSLALLTFDVGVGYAIWTSVAGVGIVILGSLFFGQRLGWRKLLGIGAVGAALLGPVFFDETLTPVKGFWLTVIIAGVVWLKLADRPQQTQIERPAAPRLLPGRRAPRSAARR